LDIDECNDPRFSADTLAYCGVNTVCTNSHGSYSCPCVTGYESFVANVGCSDINECTHPSWNYYVGSYCRSNAYCVNQEGWTSSSTYTCQCNSGYENFVANQGCNDINECCNKGSARCTHTCVQTAPNNGICVNSAGSYSCNTCYVAGAKRYSDSGTIKSHGGQGGSYSYYSSSMNKQWALKVTDGKRIRLTITAFNTESCCDKLYFTWTACEHGFFSYDWYLSGTPSVPRTYESPVGINAVNLLFKSDGSVQKSGWRLTWEAF